MGGLPDHQRYWDDAFIEPIRSPEGGALQLLAANAVDGAVVVAIGPYTNLALLEMRQPGTLRMTNVVAMGGWVQPAADGLPAWGPEIDWNVQCDTEAAINRLRSNPRPHPRHPAGHAPRGASAC
jgi:hypothetical protein